MLQQDKLPFVSCKKVLRELGEPYSSNVELCSFHTVSKGSLGECGLRGGYLVSLRSSPLCKQQQRQQQLLSSACTACPLRHAAYATALCWLQGLLSISESPDRHLCWVQEATNIHPGTIEEMCAPLCVPSLALLLSWHTLRPLL